MSAQHCITSKTAEQPLSAMSIAVLAAIVQKDWKKPYFGAVPYIEAMHHFHNDGDRYGVENAKGICTYFLCNAQTWRGETAKAVKAELKRRFNIR